jgi:hypothetical protein
MTASADAAYAAHTTFAATAADSARAAATFAATAAASARAAATFAAAAYAATGPAAIWFAVSADAARIEAGAAASRFAFARLAQRVQGAKKGGFAFVHGPAFKLPATAGGCLAMRLRRLLQRGRMRTDLNRRLN